MNRTAPPTFETSVFTAEDRTTIGRRRMGSGPGLVLLHGGMQSGQSFLRLGAALADRFTVYLPDRRGRGLSGPFGPDYSMATEVGDLRRLIDLTGAQNLFGLSSGALIALEAARGGGIARLALYEPPLRVEGQPFPLETMRRYAEEMAQGRPAAAMATIMKGIADPDWMTRLPRFVAVPLLAVLLRLLGDRGIDGGPPLRTLIPTMRSDFQLVTEMAGSVDRCRALRTPTLLLGGTRSRTFLTTALDALERVLPNAERQVLQGAGHNAADNSGQPERVAEELRRFFANAAK